MTPAELSRQVRAAFAYAARYLSVLAAGDPHGSAASLLGRPDVEAVLRQSLAEGRELAEDAVREAWTGPQHEYLSWLLGDVARSYDSLAVLRAAVRVSWHSAAPEDRAEAVKQAVLAHGSAIALRNRLSAESAAVAVQAHAQLALGEEMEAAGEQVWKQWHCRHDPPDEHTCHWCRALHGMILPLHASFPAGDPADLTGHGRLTYPPRLYHGVLHGPPRHPRCRCRLTVFTELPVVTEGGQEAAPGSPALHGGRSTGATPRFLAAADIRALTESRYQALVHFIEAAVHELAQALAKLRDAVRSARGSR